MKKSILVLGMVLMAAFAGLSGCAGKNTAATSAGSSSGDSSAAASFDGRWTGTTKIEGFGEIPLGYDFKSEGSTLTGTSDGQTGPMPIKNGKINGNKIKFDVTISLNGQDIVVNYTGVMQDDGKIKLTWPGGPGVTQEAVVTRK